MTISRGGARLAYTVLAIIALCCGQVRAQSGFEVLRGADLPGGDYLSIEGGSQKQCVAKCAGDPQCAAFTYNTGKRVCFLKESAGEPQRFAGAVSGRKQSAAPAVVESDVAMDGFEMLKGVDLPGGDIGTLRNLSLRACQQRCDAEGACAAFTYNVGKRVCFLKSNEAGRPERFAGAVSGRRTGESSGQPAVARTAKDGFYAYQDHDVKDGIFSWTTTEAKDAEACRVQCLFDDECDAFSYEASSKQCLGKRAYSASKGSLSATKAPGFVAGIKAAADVVREAREAYLAAGPSVPEADLAWRKDDTEALFVSRIRAAARPMGGPCEAETAAMQATAASVKATIAEGPGVAGKPIALRWEGKPSSGPPLWLMISADGPVRFKAEGFYALMPQAIAAFGMSADRERTRAFTTLFGQDALDGGEVEILPLRAGRLNLAVRVVGYVRGCETEFVNDVAAAGIDVTATSEPTFQVRDPFSFEQPTKIWVAPDGATRLESFDGRFRIVEAATGAAIVDREGRDPHYSPTGRFVFFTSEGDSQFVLDTMDGHIVGESRGPTGWENKDSFLVVGENSGTISASSLLVADHGSASLWRCRAACSPTVETYYLDLENDFIHVSETADRISGKARQGQGFGGDKRRWNKDVATQTGVAPLPIPVRWNFRGGLSFVPFDERWLGGAERNETDRETRQYAFVAPEFNPVTTSQQASLQPVGIGQWRGAVRLSPRRSNDGSIRERLMDLGLRFSAHTEPSFKWAEGRDFASGDTISHLRPDMAKRILAAVPKAKGAFTDEQESWPCNPLDEAPNGLEQIRPIFDQAMEFKIGQRTIWLTMFVCVEGAAAFYYPNFHLFDSAYDDGFLRIDGEDTSNSSGGACAQDISHCNFDARLYADRYFLIWSTQSRALMLFDLDTHKTIYKQFELGRGDLLKEAFYSVETGHITQVNTDGSFYVFDVPQNRRVMEGRYIDDETVAWTPDLRFDASPEGANYVFLRFPGRGGQYSFQQFARAMRTPGLVTEVFERKYQGRTLSLTLPPTLAGEISLKDGRIKGTVDVAQATSVNLYQDGLLTDTLAVAEGQARIDVEASRVAGARWISLVGIDDQGLTSQPVGVDLAVADRPVVHALTVGVDAYAALPALRYGAKDARRLAEALASQNGKSISAGATKTLVDLQASPANILEAATLLVDQAKVGETIVFSFAGHGVVGGDGRFYLATSQTRADDVAGTSLAWERLAEVLAKSRARVVVFLDACHSGAAGTALFATNDSAAANVLARIPSGLVILSASKGRQFSEESPQAGGGLFTGAVADVIAADRDTFDLDRNGAIEISELYAGVKRRVSEVSQGRQVPWLARNELVGDFALF